MLACLRETIPKLTHSSLHRCLARRGISRLPASQDKTTRGKFAQTEIGYVYINSCELVLTDLLPVS